MIFYLTAKSNKVLLKAPEIDAIHISINGEKKICHWDETDAHVGGLYVNYRFKGISFLNGMEEDEYANGSLTKESKVFFQEMILSEEVPEDITLRAAKLEISDGDLLVTAAVPSIKKEQ